MFSLTLYFMKKNKKYSFNDSAFKNFVDREGTTPTTVSKAIGKANGYWGMNCYNGSSMDASTMCQLCNTYGLSPLMFFNEDERPMKDIYQEIETKSVSKIEQKPSAAVNLTEGSGETVREYEQKMLQLTLEHKEELHRMEVKHLKESSEIREQVRKEMKAEFEADRIRLEDRYEEKLSSKDERIAQLMSDLAALQAQYKELELAQRTSGGFGYPIGVAESKADYQSK